MHLKMNFLMLCTLVAVLISSTSGVRADEVDAAYDGPHKALMLRITERVPVFTMAGATRVAIRDAEMVQKILESYASPEEFVEQLSAAWFSDNEEVRRDALVFTSCHMKLLPLGEKQWRELLQIAAQSPRGEESVAAILIKGGRPEGLEIARRWLADEDTYRVERGVSLLGLPEKLEDEDIQRLLDLLTTDRSSENAKSLAIDVSTSWRCPLSFWVLEQLMACGLADRAKDTVLNNLVWPEALAAYDEAKFARFLAEIKNPDLTMDAFWQLVKEAGFRLDETQCTEWSEDEADDEDDERSDGEEEAEDVEDEKPVDAIEHFRDYYKQPWSEKERRDYFTYSPVLADFLRQANDPRWRFMLVQACLENRTNTKTGASRKYIRHYTHNFAGINELRPMLDFIRRHPETVITDDYVRNPEAVDWGVPGKDDFTYDAIMAALACDLTPDECLEYTQASLELFAQVYETAWERLLLKAKKEYIHDDEEDESSKLDSIHAEVEWRLEQENTTWAEHMLELKDALEKQRQKHRAAASAATN